MLLCTDSHVAGRVNEHLQQLEEEVKVLQQLNHTNIVRYLVSVYL